MIICLTGMGRSGTSLMASYLRACGVSMGENLLGPLRGNPLGHFEDLDFLNFHKKLLKDNGSSLYSQRRDLRDLSVSEETSRSAVSLIQARNLQHRVWGWKDPRTTLFLRFWAEIEPSIRFIFMYRDPMNVVASLARARDRAIYINPFLAGKAWLHYNHEILGFFEKRSAASTLINIDGFNADPERGRRLLSEWLGFSLDCLYNQVYRPSEFRKGKYPKRSVIELLNYGLYRKEFASLYAQLEICALIPESLPGKFSR